MKYKLIITLCIFILPTITGCGDKNDTSGIGSSSVQSTENSDISPKTTRKENFEYNGTFNDEVCDFLFQNVSIGGDIYSFPCTLNDLGEDFTLDDDISVYDDNNTKVVALLYQGTAIATITLSAQQNDNELRDNEIVSALFSYLQLKSTDYIETVSIGEIQIGGTADSVTAYLGVPSETKESSVSYMYQYETDEGKIVKFTFENETDTIMDMSFSETNN